MGKADLHIHTRYGDGLDSIEAIFEHVETRTDLDVIAITEHDNLKVALEAREVWGRRRYRFDLVTGAEVTTLEGHLVALFLEEPVASLKRVEATLEDVHAQGGLCFVPHPLSWLTRSIGEGTLQRVQADPGVSFDAMELSSASPIARLYLGRARRLNDERYGLPEVGASDAHFVEAIASAYTSFGGTTAAELRQAIVAGRTQGGVARFPSLREVGLVRGISVPVTGLRASPRVLGWRRTAWSFVGRYLP